MSFLKVIWLSEALHFLVLLLAWTNLGGLLGNMAMAILPDTFNEKELFQTETF